MTSVTKKSNSAITTSVEHALEVLRKQGLRITTARKQILTALASSSTPLSASEVIVCAEEQGEKDATVDKVTVYRVLETLVRHGLVHQLSPDGRYIFCEHHSCSSPLHALLRCSRCNAISEVHIPQALASSIDNFVSMHHSTRDSHALELQVVCRNCSKKV
jgi:Fe2+ or Zn2+ uptake regulation protein